MFEPDPEILTTASLGKVGVLWLLGKAMVPPPALLMAVSRLERDPMALSLLESSEPTVPMLRVRCAPLGAAGPVAVAAVAATIAAASAELLFFLDEWFGSSGVSMVRLL